MGYHFLIKIKDPQISISYYGVYCRIEKVASHRNLTHLFYKRLDHDARNLNLCYLRHICHSVNIA